MNEERKVSRQTIGMIIGAGFIVLMAICLFIAFGVNKCNEKKEAAELAARRYVVLKDETTGQKYELWGETAGGASIEYDGRTHRFSYEIYEIGTKKPTGQKGTIDTPIKHIKDEILTKIEFRDKDGNLKSQSVRIYISPIKPLLKLDPNGAVNYEENKWYEYKYTGEPCYPKAWVEYEGKEIPARIDIEGPNRLPQSKLVEVGIYTVDISVAYYRDESDNRLYACIATKIQIKIVE